MPQTIHMETESVRNLCESIKQYANNIEESNRFHKTIMESMMWEGGSYDDVFFQLNTILMTTSDLKIEVESIYQRLQQEVIQWEQADSSFSDLISSGYPNRDLADNFISGGIFTPLMLLFGREIDKIFDFYAGDRRGIALLEACEDANLRFEFLDEDGNIHFFGAEDGDVVKISWVDPNELGENVGGGYSVGPPPEIRINDKLKSGLPSELRGTIAHEMQHALDYQTGRANPQIKQRPYNDIEEGPLRHMTENELDNYDWSTLEESLEASCAERVKTEIAAHTRGYEFDSRKQIGEGVLNFDNTYTPEEQNIILTDRGYADNYEQNIRDSFLNQGITVDVDVYWDESSNEIQVKILDANNLIYARETYYA